MNDIIAIINEELQSLYEQQQVYTIPDLAQLLTRAGHQEQSVPVFQKMLFDKYRQGGDDAVIKMYGDIAGVQIEALRNGRYMFANLGGGGQPHSFGDAGNRQGVLREIQDNANHCPDEMPS